MSSTKKRILIYSSGLNEADIADRVLPYSADSRHEFVSNLDDLLMRLSSNEYDLIIIESKLDILRLISGIKRVQSDTGLSIPLLFDDFSDTSTISQAKSNRPTESRKMTLKRKHEAVFAPEEKIKTITETAATLMHEINNPLMAITANTEILLENYSHLPDDFLEKVRTISSAAARIRKVTDILVDLDMLNYRETAAGRIISLENIGIDKSPRIKEEVLT